MILIGQYDSPFVRRVGIALTLYGVPFEHRPWSVFGDAEAIRRYNPLVRVPTLVLDDGEVLGDSHVILDYVDSLAPPGEALVPSAEPARRGVLRIVALATGMADKAVALFYELRLHEHVSERWMERCRGQVLATLATLEADRAARPGPYWFGDRFGHADIAVACALRHLSGSHPDLIDFAGLPALSAHRTDGGAACLPGHPAAVYPADLTFLPFGPPLRVDDAGRSSDCGRGEAQPGGSLA